MSSGGCVKLVFRVSRWEEGREGVELLSREDAGVCPALARVVVEEELPGEWLMTVVVPPAAAGAAERVAKGLRAYGKVDLALREAVGHIRRALGISEDEEPVYRLVSLYRKGSEVYELEVVE
ncbi:MAG: hypothetical protein QXW41_07450 [Fervidicoccaceae archaeon]